MNPLLLKVSVSNVIKYLSCPQTYNLGQVQKVKVPKTFPKELQVGIHFHSVLESHYKTPVKSSLPEMTAELQKRITQMGDPELIAVLPTYVTLLTRIYPQLPDPKSIIATEKSFTVPMGEINGRDCVLSGRWDMLIQEVDGIVINDYKTRGSDYGTDLLLFDMQMSAYAYAYQKLFNELPQSQFFSLYKDTGDVIKTRVTYTPKALQEIEHSLMCAFWGIANNHYYLNNGFACRFCDFKHVCFDPNKLTTLWTSKKL